MSSDVGAALVKSIRVMIVDDHPTVRRGVATLLSAHGERFDVVAQVGTGAEALDTVETCRPNIVLTDLHMKPMDGITLIKTMRSRYSELDVRFVVFTAFGGAENASNAVAAGASGFVVKDSDEGELPRAIEAAIHGSFYCSAELASTVIKMDTKSSQKPATARELEVLKCIAEGLMNKQIASKLSIDVRTVETHRANIIEKFQLPSGQLVKFAVERSWE